MEEGITVLPVLVGLTSENTVPYICSVNVVLAGRCLLLLQVTVDWLVLPREPNVYYGMR